MTTDTALDGGAPEAAPAVESPRVRMDRSRSFATIHGDRQVDDPLYGVAYRQDGIPCDAEGFFLFEHKDMLRKGRDGDHARKMAEKHIKRALLAAAKAPPKPARAAPSDDEDDEVDADGVARDGGEGEDEGDGLLPAINLGEWLRGRQDVPWADVSQEIARAYKRRIAKVDDAVPFLVKEGLCPRGELRQKFKKYVDE